MKMIMIDVLICVLVILFIVSIFLGYPSRIKTVNSIKKLAETDDGLNLYFMDYGTKYDSQKIVDADADTIQKYVDAILKESLPGIPVHMKVSEFGCSGAFAETKDGDFVFGRNYDAMKPASVVMAYFHSPKAYKSVSFLSTYGFTKNEIKSFAQKIPLLVAPYVGVDGMNEKGLSLAALILDSEITKQKDPDKKSISTLLFVRKALDSCSTVDEALEILKSHNMVSLGGDFHFMITDASGKSVVAEYDFFDDEGNIIEDGNTAERKLVIIENPHLCTNFFRKYLNEIRQDPRIKEDPMNLTVYGHGYLRYTQLEKSLENFKTEKENYKINSERDMMNALKSCAQDGNNQFESYTQWSAVFNNTKKTVDVAIHRNYDKVVHFDLKKGIVTEK